MTLKCRRLDEVCDITMGQAPSSDSYNTDSQGLPLIAGAGDFTGDRPTAKKFTTSPLRVCETGDLVLSIRASIGAKVVADRPYCLGRGVAGLRPRPELDPRFLWYWLRQEARTLKSKGRGATFLQVNRNDVAEMQIGIPPLPEQRRIAAILDQADALRTKRHQVIAGYDNLVLSTYRHAIAGAPCDIYELNEIADLYSGGTLPAGEAFAGQQHGTLLMKVSDMNAANNGDTVAATALWSSEATSRSATVEAGAVVFPKRGASIATNKKRLTSRRTALDPNLMGIQPKPSLVASRYLHEWFKNFDLTTITSGSTVPQLNKQDLAPLQIPVPALDKQVEIERRISAILDNRVLAERSLVELDELALALQTCAFSGELFA